MIEEVLQDTLHLPRRGLDECVYIRFKHALRRRRSGALVLAMWAAPATGTAPEPLDDARLMESMAALECRFDVIS